MKRPLALLSALAAALLICAACSPLAPSSSLEQPSSSLPPEAYPTDALLAYATVYELYCGGKDYRGPEDYQKVLSYAFGWLNENELVAPYLDAVSGSYALPQEAVQQLCDFFFGVDVTPSEGEHLSLNYSADYQTGENKLNLSVTDCARDGENLLLTLARTYDGKPLYPVRYTFSPYTVSDPPAVLAGKYQTGDLLYRITKVENLLDTALTAVETRELSTPADLVNLAERINSGDRDAQRYKYVLACDLDMTGVAFRPIGTNERLMPFEDFRDPTRAGFNAVLDGQGHTIRNLTVSVSAPVAPERPLYGGLFARIGERGMVKNLILKDCTVTLPMKWVPEANDSAAGLLAGRVDGTVSGVTVSGSVTGNAQIGGLAGIIGGYDVGGAQVSDCRAEQVLVSGNGTVGGFAGLIHGGRVTRCAVTGEVRAIPNLAKETPGAIGGFAGHAIEAKLVADCASSVTIKTMVTSRWVGAFMGGCEGRGGTVYTNRYDLTKAPGWKIIDYSYVYDNSPAPDVRGVSSAEVAAFVQTLTPPEETK